MSVHGSAAATLAFVSDEPDNELMEEFYGSPLAKRFWPEGRMFMSSRHLILVAQALANITVGQVVRVRTAGECFEIYPADQRGHSGHDHTDATNASTSYEVG